MAAIFEPSLSTSALRAPLASTDALSMADSLPNINFGFEELRDRMARFTDCFDEFIARGRKRVLEERNQFRMNVAELQDDQRMKSKDIEILTHKFSTHAQYVAKEAAETAEMHTAIANITSQRDARAAHRDKLRAETASLQKSISQRLEAQKEHSESQDAQARFNEPELAFWVNHLCMRLEGAGEDDHLQFVFSHLDERSWEREAFIELDMSRRDYRVVRIKPKVQEQDLERCVEKLNENRELAMFLKTVRELFVEAMT